MHVVQCRAHFQASGSNAGSRNEHPGWCVLTLSSVKNRNKENIDRIKEVIICQVGWTIFGSQQRIKCLDLRLVRQDSNHEKTDYHFHLLGNTSF